MVTTYTQDVPCPEVSVDLCRLCKQEKNKDIHTALYIFYFTLHITIVVIINSILNITIKHQPLKSAYEDRIDI